MRLVQGRMVGDDADAARAGEGEPRSSPRMRAAQPARAAPAIDRAASRIAAVRRRYSIGSACDVGAIIVEEIYGGDLTAFRSRGAKDASLRTLAAHPKLDSSAATLWRAVGVFLLCQRMPGFREPKHVGLAHLYSVLCLCEQDQERLLRLAEVERWSKEKLAERVATLRPGVTRSRPRTLRQLGPLRRLVALPAAEIDLNVGSGDLAEIERLLGDLDRWAEALRVRIARERELKADFDPGRKD